MLYVGRNVQTARFKARWFKTVRNYVRLRVAGVEQETTDSAPGMHVD